MPLTAYLGRQPVLDRHRRTFGYELLFRSGTTNAAVVEDQDAATRQIVERTLLEWGIEHVLHGKVGLINVGSGFLLSRAHELLPPHQVILELLEDIVYTPEVIAAAREARAAGYRFALDDIVLESDIPDEILELADILKVDVLAVDRVALGDLVCDLRERAPEALVLAEKVEEVEDFEDCLKVGFDLFQGYFFAKPEVLSRSARPVNSTTALALLVEVQRPTVDVRRMEELVTGDPTLAFKLLSLVNSSQTGLQSRVSSIQQAIVLLGIAQVRQLATLLTVAANTSANPELLVLAATRAEMARRLAPSASSSSAFTVGLLSVLDAIFRTPMAELVGELPLDRDVAAALLGEPGALTSVLRTVLAYESADVDALEQLHSGDADELRTVFGDAVAWAHRFTGALVV